MPSEDSAPSEDSKPEDSLPDGNTDTEDSSSDPNTSSDDTETDVSAFDDTVFIGDSRTLGLQMATGLTNATFLAERNMAVNRGEEKFFRLSDGSKGTLYQALAEKQYQKVYVMFGVNELGWPEASTFADSYAIMLDRIRESQPNATIYVQSILPITKERSDSDTIYNNTNVNLFNEAIRQMVATRDVVYLDVASVFRDTDGALFADASTDGIHLTFEYCGRWLQYLADHQ
jgi:lysophospholipase L1-like esterase